MKNKNISALIDERLASHMAAALADPDVDPVAKSLAGFLLQRLTEQKEEEILDSQLS